MKGTKVGYWLQGSRLETDTLSNLNSSFFDIVASFISQQCLNYQYACTHRRAHICTVLVQCTPKNVNFPSQFFRFAFLSLLISIGYWNNKKFDFQPYKLGAGNLPNCVWAPVHPFGCWPVTKCLKKESLWILSLKQTYRLTNIGCYRRQVYINFDERPPRPMTVCIIGIIGNFTILLISNELSSFQNFRSRGG